jgi:phosphosulfolactate phosphohydrolase-like enzyme
MRPHRSSTTNGSRILLRASWERGVILSSKANLKELVDPLHLCAVDEIHHASGTHGKSKSL